MLRPIFILAVTISLIIHAMLLLWPGAMLASPTPPHLPTPKAASAQTTVEVQHIPASQPVPRETAASEPRLPQTHPPQRSAGSRPESSTSARPQPSTRPSATAPALKQTAATRASREGDGSFAGDTEGRAQPQLRIDWGDTSHALGVLRTGDMKLAIIDTRGRILAGATLVPTSRRTSWRLSPGDQYTNQLRIVDGVPAFAPLVSSLQLDPQERLAVLLPSSVEQMIQSRQLAAAYRRGAGVDDVAVYGGRFELRGRQLEFEITSILEREQPR